LKLYQEVSKALTQFSSQFPNWSPQVVKYRSQLTAAALQRLQTGAAAPTPKPASAQPAPPKTASAQAQEATPLIPQAPDKGDVSVAPTDPFAEIQKKLSQLQNDLQFALEEAQRLRKEKSELLRNLEDTANSASKALEENIKAREKAESIARILEQRSDVAERALLQAREDKTKTADELAAGNFRPSGTPRKRCAPAWRRALPRRRDARRAPLGSARQPRSRRPRPKNSWTP
jgi:regulator of replication initiation timing